MNLFFERLTQVMKQTLVLKLEIILVSALVLDRGCSSSLNPLFSLPFEMLLVY